MSAPNQIVAQTQAARDAVDAAIARKNLLEFAFRVYPEFVAPPHLRLLASLLERVDRGELRRLIVSLHPGSGKSTLLQLFCSWYLGRNPDRWIISTSAEERLVVRNARAVRDVFGDPAWPFVARLAPDATDAGVWKTDKGGGMFSIGVEGKVTGWRGPLIVCDDLQDGPGSKLDRDSLEDWFRGKLVPRLEPDGAIVIVQARWSKDDLPGRLMSGPRGGSWEYVRIPALSEGDGDPLGRPEGEPLWPQRWGVAELEERREMIGSKHFAAQYQGSPVVDGGEVFRAEWFERYRRDELPRDETGTLSFDRVFCALDAASKTGVRNDYSVVVTMGERVGKFYLLDVRRERVEYPGLKRLVQTVFDKWRPSRFYVEDTANATALIQQLKDESHLPIIPVKVTASKEARAESVSGLVEAGRIVLPTDAPWLADFEDEVCSFPSADHDDQVDAFVMALSQAVNKPTCFSFSFGPGAPDDLMIDGKRAEPPDDGNGIGVVVPPGHSGGVTGALSHLLGGR